MAEKTKIKVLISIIIVLLLLIGAGIYIFLNHGTETPSNIQPDESAVEYDGDKATYHMPNGQKGIAIPGIESLVFQKDTTTQKVNFFNPEGNDCLFLMTLLVDNDEYWHSGYCAAGTGYYDIELNNSLAEGDYSACLNIQCFRADGTALNGANVEFNLYVR